MISETHLHAMIIHFPIALLLTSFFSEVVSFLVKQDFFRNAAFYFLLLGTLAGIATYITGTYAGFEIEEAPLKGPLELLQQAAGGALWLSIIFCLLVALVNYFKYNRIWVKCRDSSFSSFDGLIGQNRLSGRAVGAHSWRRKFKLNYRILVTLVIGNNILFPYL